MSAGATVVRARRVVAAAASAALLALAAGCGGPEGGVPKILRIAYVSGPSELLHHAAERMAGRIREASGGRIEARLYPSGQLGNDRELIEGLKLRSVDMIISGTAMVGWYAPEYGVIEAPFLWRDYEHIERVWNGPAGADLRAVMERRAGARLLRPWYRGPRYLTTTSRKVLSPDDLRGLKLRVPELEVYIKAWQIFGASVTPIPFTDMFMALKLGVVEGQENPLATIVANHLDEVQKYVMETRHLIGFYISALGPSFEHRFDEAERRLILDAFDEATAWHNLEVERTEAEYRAKLEAAGVEFVPIDVEPFRVLTLERLPPLFSKVWKPGLYQRISEAGPGPRN